MRYDQTARLHVILMVVAYKHSKGEKITGQTVWEALPDKFLALHRVVMGMKYLADIGAIVWAERARGRLPGRVKSVHPEKLGLHLKIGRMTAERQIKKYLDLGVIRNQAGRLVLDGEAIVTDSLVEALREQYPEADFDWLFRQIDGLPLENLLKVE